MANFNDSLTSLVAGLGDPMRDKLAGSSYGAILLNRQELANIYQSNWIGRKIVRIPAEDAVRKGRDWQAEGDQIGLIEAEENRLGFWPKLLDAQIKARLWGGAAIYIGTGDTDVAQPLNVDRVKKGGLKYLTVLSLDDLIAGPTNQDVLSEFYGRPDYYDVTGAAELMRIHPSRLAIFIGNAQPDPLLAVQNRGWGDSVLQAVYSAMRHADATAANIASLVFEANVDVFRIPDFMSSLAGDPGYSNRLVQRFILAATAKGINRALILDKEEEYDRKTVSFATLPEIMQSFLQMVSGAADIPVTRFLGQSPAGMSATGESDMRNYHDRINTMQSLEITPAIHRLDECLIRSALGERPPELFYSWSPLEQMSEKQLAEIGKMNAETANTLVTAGLFTPEELRRVVTTQMVESSFYPGLDQVVAETDAAGGFDLGQDDPAPTDRAPTDPAYLGDAAPRTLYVRRDVLNASDIIAWAKEQGFKTTLPADDMHVTIAFSREPVDWMAVGESWSSKLEVAAGGPRIMEQFGEARVLLFKASELQWRHEGIREAGASWDHPEYQPHITISYDPGSPDLTTVEPYQGEIILGPEIFEEVKLDWEASLQEA